jgi:hypothetical protein
MGEHSRSGARSVQRSGGRGTEQPGDEGREALIQSVDQRHHDADKDEHNARVAEQLAPGWGNDLAKLDKDLADEKRDASKRAAPLGALLPRVGDDILTRLVDHFACHTHNLSNVFMTCRL